MCLLPESYGKWKVARRADWNNKGEINIAHVRSFEMYVYPFYLLLIFISYRISNAVEASDFHHKLEKLWLNLVYKSKKNPETYHGTDFPTGRYSPRFVRKFCCKWAMTLSSLIILFLLWSYYMEFRTWGCNLQCTAKAFCWRSHSSDTSTQGYLIWAILLVIENFRASLHCTASTEHVQDSFAHEAQQLSQVLHTPCDN